MTSDLRELTKEYILTEGRFQMDVWSDIVPTSKDSLCGAAGCIAGNIVAAAIQLGLYPEGSEFFRVSVGRLCVDFDGAARYAWEKIYGKEEAHRLDFTCWHDLPLELVTPAMAVRHLEGEDPAVLVQETRGWKDNVAVMEHWSEWDGDEDRDEDGEEGTGI